MNQSKSNSKTFCAPLASLGFIFCLVTGNATYADTTVTNCDTLAGNSNDPNKVTSGISFDAINVALAEPACNAAVTNDPTNPRLQYEYGRVFDAKGDYASALVWYDKAAAQNYAEAESHLGTFYQYGFGGFIDYVQAFNWYQKAADQNFASAQAFLGDLYFHGLGISKDLTQAFTWSQKAANAGEPTGIGNLDLGSLYHNGQAVAKNEAKALEQWRIGSKLGLINASIELVFSWAEAKYPDLLLGFAASQPDSLPPPYDNFSYRHYTTANNANIYVGYNFSDQHVYYFGPATGNTLVDLGVIDPFLQQALAYEQTVNGAK